jgi:hypothetical protein
VYQTLGQFAPTVTGMGGEKVPEPVPPPQAPEGVRQVVGVFSPVAGSDGSVEALAAARPVANPRASAGIDLAGPEPRAGTPLAGLVPFDLEVLERGADHFFALLTRLGEEWADGTVVTRVVPWLAAVAGAFELARLRKERSSGRAVAGDGWGAGPAVLQPGGEP